MQIPSSVQLSCVSSVHNQGNLGSATACASAAAAEALMKIKQKPSRALKPDAQAFDEIRIVTVPRYKQSGLSGDEWRISARIEFWRKGKLILESACGDIESAVTLVGARYLEAVDNGNGYFAGEGDICDQEGCAEPATVTYKVKKEYSRDNPHEWNKPYDHLVIRKFCNKHKRRGDCGMDDADENYEKIG